MKGPKCFLNFIIFEENASETMCGVKDCMDVKREQL